MTTIDSKGVSLRLLIVTPWFPNRPLDHHGNFILHSAEALLEEGVAVNVLVCRPWVPQIFRILHTDWIRPTLCKDFFNPDLNIGIAHYVTMPRSLCNELFGPFFRLAARAAIRQIVRDKRIQLIHVHTETVGYAMAPIAKELGIPIVITIHGINTEPRLLDTEWKRTRLREALRGAERVILVGESLGIYFTPLAGGDANFRVVHNGFRLPAPQADAARGVWGEVVRLISVSNLHEGKGIDLNIDALARLRAAGFEDWTYSIVGDGAERSRLDRMTDQLGLCDKVSFHGAVSHDRALALLAAADVFVLPSYREAFGIAYLEAMGSGLLAIGVSGQGPSAFIRHGETGLLVEPNDVESLYLAIKSVFEQRPGMQRIAAAGRRLAKSEFTWAHHAKKLAKVYSEVLGGR